MFKTTTKTRLKLPRTEEEKEHMRVQSFLDMNAPAAVKAEQQAQVSEPQEEQGMTMSM